MGEVLFSCMAKGKKLQREQKGYFAQILHVGERRETLSVIISVVMGLLQIDMGSRWQRGAI